MKEINFVKKDKQDKNRCIHIPVKADAVNVRSRWVVPIQSANAP